MEEKEINSIANAINKELAKLNIAAPKETKEETKGKEIVPEVFICPECGGEVTGGIKYCMHCGCELEWEA